MQFTVHASICEARSVLLLTGLLVARDKENNGKPRFELKPYDDRLHAIHEQALESKSQR